MPLCALRKHANFVKLHIYTVLATKHKAKANSVPWITPAIKQQMRNRDYHKTKAIKFNSSTHWAVYKTTEQSK